VHLENGAVEDQARQPLLPAVAVVVVQVHLDLQVIIHTRIMAERVFHMLSLAFLLTTQVAVAVEL